jgi:pimeloyl-ACP methyl ester carboxylesterase
MRQFSLFFLGLIVLLLAVPALAQNMLPLVPACDEVSLGIQQTLICRPDDWDGTGDWVVYAHGYVAPQEEPALPIEELTVDGLFLPSLILAEGYAFATTIYSETGFGIQQAADDMNALVLHLIDYGGETGRFFAVGASEGGLVTTMLVEQHHELYAGGLSMCGPVAGSPFQIQYVGDFRVVFDFYFPFIFDFGAVDIPDWAYYNWDNYTPRIALTMLFRPYATNKLFRITGAARDPARPVATGIETALTLLFYNISGTTDLSTAAGGNVFDNQTRWYGTRRNWLLNLLVERLEAEEEQVQYLRDSYEPTGELLIPLVTVHNLLDPAVPFEHETIYADRVDNEDLFAAIPVPGYGHCSFEPPQILGAFDILVCLANGGTKEECLP